MLQLIGALALCITAISLGLWWYVGFRFLRGHAPVPYEPRTPVPWGLADIGVLMFAQATASVLAHAYFSFQRPELGEAKLTDLSPDLQVQTIYLGSVSLLAGIFALTIWLIVRYRVTAQEFGTRMVARDLFRGSIAFLMLAPIVYGLQSLLIQFYPSAHPLIEMLTSSFQTEILVSTGVAAVVVAPFVEEVFFRVMLQGWLERLASGDTDMRVMWGGRTDSAASLSSNQSPAASDTTTSHTTAVRPAVWPVWASAALFALAHWSHGPDPIPLFVLALGLGYMYRQTHRLLPCVVLHFLLNAVSFSVLCAQLWSSGRS